MATDPNTAPDQLSEPAAEAPAATPDAPTSEAAVAPATPAARPRKAPKQPRLPLDEPKIHRGRFLSKDDIEDAVAQMICEGYFFEQMTDKELEELTNLDAKELASKKRAITRALAKSCVGGHLR